MNKPEPQKRTLTYNQFDDMLADVRRMLDHGYIPHGKWTLGQACSHIADWMRFPMDGFPTPPWFIRAMMWGMKITIGPGMKRKILAEGFKSGMPTAPETVPLPEVMSDRQGAEKLEKTVKRLLAHEGEFQPSPVFGPMDQSTLVKVSLLHAEHHLGYLEPID